LGLLHHPFVVGFRGAALKANGTVYIAMRYASQSLHDALYARDAAEELTAPRRVAVMAQLASAVEYIHRERVLHRDLCPKNVLLTGGPESHVLLADFGFARRLRSDVDSAESDDDGKWTPLVVTLWYRAPEVLSTGRYSTGVDTWALGCIAAEVCRRQPLLPGQSEAQQVNLINQLVAGGETMLRAALRDVHTAARPPELLSSVTLALLVANPGARASAAQAAERLAGAARAAASYSAQGRSLPRTRYLSDVELASSPTRRDGLTADEEAYHRWVLVSFIYSVATEVVAPSALNQVADAAALYSLRFYCCHAFGRKQFASHAVGCAALLLSSKSLHTLLHPKALAKLSYRKRYPSPEGYTAAVEERLVHSIVEAEWRLALVLGFALSVHPPRVYLAQPRPLPDGAAARARSLALAAMHTQLPLQHCGATLAACCLAMVLKRCGAGDDDEAACQQAATALDVDVPAPEVLAEIDAALLAHLSHVARDVATLAWLTDRPAEEVAARLGVGRRPERRRTPALSPAHHAPSPSFWPGRRLE
jgi:serine/threonine protein kinase